MVRGGAGVKLGRALAAAVVAAACAAAAVVLGGCGAASVIDPVARAATVSNQARGYRALYAMRISSPALPAPVTVGGSGSFDTIDRSGSLDIRMDLSGIPQAKRLLGSNTLQIQAILSGLTIYMKVPPALARFSSALKPWLEINLASATQAQGLSGISSLSGDPMSSDPSQFLRYLRAISGSVTRVGAASVDGIQTTEYRGQVDLNRVPDVVPAASRAEARRTIKEIEQMTHLHVLPVKVWVDANHLVRRMRFSLQENAAGAGPLAMTMTIDIPQYGPQQPPQLPPASEVTNLTGRLGAAPSTSSG